MPKHEFDRSPRRTYVARINMLQRIERNRLDKFTVGRHRAPYEPRHGAETIQLVRGADILASVCADAKILNQIRRNQVIRALPGARHRDVGKHRVSEFATPYEPRHDVETFYSKPTGVAVYLALSKMEARIEFNRCQRRPVGHHRRVDVTQRAELIQPDFDYLRRLISGV